VAEHGASRSSRPFASLGVSAISASCMRTWSPLR
jgi:hypothetical protein